MRYLWTIVGLPYRWGGDDLIDGLDCSGLAVLVLQAVGLMPWGSDQTADGLRLRFSKYILDSPRPGCLALYGKRHHATHVGVVCKVIDGVPFMIEAGGGGSKTFSPDDAARHNAFVKLAPVHRRPDFIGYVDPFMSV